MLIYEMQELKVTQVETKLDNVNDEQKILLTFIKMQKVCKIVFN